MNLKIYSININGFRSKHKQLYIKDILKNNNIDILCLQETYVDTFFLSRKIENILDLNKKCIWSYGQTDSKGTAILINNDSIHINKFQTDFNGRTCFVDFEYLNNNIRLVNIYAPNSACDRNEFFTDLYPYLTTSHKLILTGDFNCVFNTAIDKIGGNLDKGSSGSKILKNIIDKYKLSDAFRFKYPNKRSVTWSSNQQSLGCRLDRFYVSKLLETGIVDSSIAPCTNSDHDFITLKLNISDSLAIGKSYWKLNNTILDNENFISTFIYYWQIISRSTDISLNWWDNMKSSIKEFCIDYSKQQNSETYSKLKTLKQQYITSSTLEQKCELKENIKTIENTLSKGVLIRSKAHIIDSNENPTSYFFQTETSKNTDKLIYKIQKDGISFTDTENITNCFTHFYKELYAEETVDLSLNNIFLNNLPQVAETENSMLGAPITKAEVLKCLKQMDSTKTPGSDGLTSAFYIKFFNIFGDILVKLYNLCFELGEMSESQKYSYITLICKDKTNSSDMKNYRPISLLNVDRKILSKIIANRLSSILPNIIGISQTCSIKGRTIFDNIHLIRNVFDYIEQKNIAACFINLDQEKAFDRVSWSYMFETLNAFGFSKTFIQWIQLLYKDITSSVIVNHFISDSFQLERSVRQGCALSPLLYVLCFEPLAKKVQDDKNIHGLLVPGGKFHLKMSLYADDNTGIFTDDSSVKRFFDHICLFQRLSGSKINYRKSSGLYLGKWKNRSDHPFGISWVQNTKLLGYHVGYNLSPDDIWSTVFNKWSNTLNIWKHRDLSFKGKSTILNSLLLPKIIYYVTCNLLPTHYLNIIQRACFRFIWNSTFEPILRKTLYLPLLDGGLNIPNIKLKCDSLYLYHLQKLINNDNAVWTFFTKYWIGLSLRSNNKSLAEINFPHSTDYIPHFYKKCMDTYRVFSNYRPDSITSSFQSKHFYCLLNKSDYKPKCTVIFPTIQYNTVFKNIFSQSIDYKVKSLHYRMAHDVLYVNYYLFSKRISKIKSCTFCTGIETVTHLFMECKFVNPLNKAVIFLLNKVSDNKVTFSERTFRFLELPTLDKYIHNISLVLISESRYIIWRTRNLSKHEQKSFNKLSLITMFISRVKFRILSDFNRLNYIEFLENWCTKGLCTYVIDNNLQNTVKFNECLSVEFYRNKFNL